jgi:hypothetical protein
VPLYIYLCYQFKKERQKRKGKENSPKGNIAYEWISGRTLKKASFCSVMKELQRNEPCSE